MVNKNVTKYLVKLLIIFTLNVLTLLLSLFQKWHTQNAEIGVLQVQVIEAGIFQEIL